MAIDQKRERLREAAQFIKQGDHKSAQTIFRELIKANPRDAELWYLYSFAATEKDHQIKSLEKTLTFAPDHAKAKERLAQLRGEVPVPPRDAPKPTTPSYALLAGGGALGLILVVLIAGFVLSRSQNAETLITPTQPPTATFNIVTREPTQTSEAVLTETPTVAAVADKPTFVPTSPRLPTETSVPISNPNVVVLATSTQRIIVIPTQTSVPAPKISATPPVAIDVPLPSLTTFGGGTGRILVSSEIDSVTKFSMVDLHNGSVSDLAVPEGYTQATWVSDGLQVLMSKGEWLELCQGADLERVVTTLEPCLGLMTVSTGAVTTLSNFPSVALVALSPDRRQMAYVTHEIQGSIWWVWVANLDGTDRRRIAKMDLIAPEMPVWSPDSRFIAYQSYTQIHLVASDGTDDRDFVRGTLPSWSPDGQSVIFAYGARDNNIYIKDVNTEIARKLYVSDEAETGFITGLAFSPDGSLIAFVRGGVLYVMKADGTELTRVAEVKGTFALSWQLQPQTDVGTPTPTPSPSPTVAVLGVDEAGGGTGSILFTTSSGFLEAAYHVFDLRDSTLSDMTLPAGVKQARWSQDGRSLVGLTVPQTGDCDGSDITFTTDTITCITLMDSLGRLVAMQVRMPRTPGVMGLGRVFDVSPEGTQIAYMSYEASERPQLWVMQLDGTGRRQVTSAPDGVEMGMRWTPDGRFITYVIYNPVTNQPEIHLIASDGTQERLLIANAAEPAWSPDGTQLAYVARDEDATYLYIADADGANVRQITYRGISDDFSFNDSNPVWSPDGQLIAFVRDGTDLYVVQADGREERFLIKAVPGEGLGNLSWQPQPASVPLPTLTPLPTYTPLPSSTPTPTATPTLTPSSTPVPRPPLIIATAVPASNSTVGGGTGRIRYSVITGQGGYYTLDLNDMTTTDLSKTPREIFSTWLADGRRVTVFRGTEDGSCGGIETNERLCFGLMNPDTLEVRLFTNFPWMSNPQIGPDMNRIAYVAQDQAAQDQVFLINFDGSNFRQLTTYAPGSGTVYDLAWSADGRFLAYSVTQRSDTASSTRIDRVSMQGSDQVVFIPNARMPSWSPDGKSLAYIAAQQGSRNALVIANGDNTNPRRITIDDTPIITLSWPVWSPDSKRLLVINDIMRTSKLYMIDAQSGDTTVLVTVQGILSKATWQPLPSASADVWPTSTPALTPTVGR